VAANDSARRPEEDNDLASTRRDLEQAARLNDRSVIRFLRAAAQLSRL
jgi:hypothetical protein